MEQYHYIWMFKALFILAGMVTQYTGYVYKTRIGELKIGLSGGSISMLVLVKLPKDIMIESHSEGGHYVKQ